MLITQISSPSTTITQNKPYSSKIFDIIKHVVNKVLTFFSEVFFFLANLAGYSFSVMQKEEAVNYILTEYEATEEALEELEISTDISSDILNDELEDLEEEILFQVNQITEFENKIEVLNRANKLLRCQRIRIEMNHCDFCFSEYAKFHTMDYKKQWQDLSNKIGANEIEIRGYELNIEHVIKCRKKLETIRLTKEIEKFDRVKRNEKPESIEAKAENINPAVLELFLCILKTAKIFSVKISQGKFEIDVKGKQAKFMLDKTETLSGMEDSKEGSLLFFGYKNNKTNDFRDEITPVDHIKGYYDSEKNLITFDEGLLFYNEIDLSPLNDIEKKVAPKHAYTSLHQIEFCAKDETVILRTLKDLRTKVGSGFLSWDITTQIKTVIHEKYGPSTKYGAIVDGDKAMYPVKKKYVELKNVIEKGKKIL